MPVEETLRETEQAYVELAEDYDQLREEYDALLDQIKWIHAVASILIEEQGGMVRISNEVLSTYDLRGQVKIWRNANDDTWVAEAIPYEETE